MTSTRGNINMTTKLMFGVFLLAVAMVMPSLAWNDFQGPVCRFVTTSTEAVINETSCPFSDMDPPPFICVNSSKGISNNQGNRREGASNGNDDDDDDDDFFGFDFWGLFNPRPRPSVRKDHCQLQLKIRQSCNTDADCTSYPGLLKSRCLRNRWIGSFCAPDISSVAMAMLAARPCEIRRQNGDRVTFTDLTNCRSQDSIWDMDLGFDLFKRDDVSKSPRVCESSPSLTARVGEITYSIKTCVPDSSANNNNENTDNGGDP